MLTNLIDFKVAGISGGQRWLMLQASATKSRIEAVDPDLGRWVSGWGLLVWGLLQEQTKDMLHAAEV